MMTKLAAVMLFLATSAFAQVPVYTNADLGKPAKYRHKITAEEYRSLLAHQFVYAPPPDPWRDFLGPRVAIAGYTPPSAVQALLPPPTWLVEPFYMSTYTGRHRHHGPRSVRPEPPPTRSTPPPASAQPTPPPQRRATPVPARGSWVIRR